MNIPGLASAFLNFVLCALYFDLFSHRLVCQRFQDGDYNKVQEPGKKIVFS